MRIHASLTLSALALTAFAGTALAEDIVTTGSLTASYAYNFNRPQSGLNSFRSNNKDGQFQVSYAELKLAKEADDEKAGFVLRFLEGDARRQFLSAMDDDRLFEAYVTSKSESGKITGIDFGQFLSHLGYETPQSEYILSRSFHSQLLLPLYGAGIRAHYMVNDNTNATFYLYNRFNGVDDPGNRNIAPGFKIVRMMGEDSTLSINGLFGKDSYDISPVAGVTNYVSRQTNAVNVVYQNKVSDTTKIAAELTTRTGKTPATNASYNALGVSGYLFQERGNGDTLSFRGELVRQNKIGAGLVVNNDGGAAAKTLTSITAGYRLKKGLITGATTLIEVRFDHADQPFFVGKNGGLKKDQSVLSIGQVVRF
jgi:hypothetical protein